MPADVASVKARLSTEEILKAAQWGLSLNPSCDRCYQPCIKRHCKSCALECEGINKILPERDKLWQNAL